MVGAVAGQVCTSCHLAISREKSAFRLASPLLGLWTPKNLCRVRVLGGNQQLVSLAGVDVA